MNTIMTKRSTLRWALTLTVVLAAGSLKSATFHVAQQAPNAADNNPGTEQRPWNTISKAASALQPGDTVVVHTGVYRETVTPLHSGTELAPITYGAAPDEKVIVTGADLITGWQREAGEAPIYRVPWTHVFAIDHRRGRPIEHHPEDAPLWGRAEQVMADGHQLLPVATRAELAKAWQTHHQSSGPSPVLKTPLPHLGPAFAGAFVADTQHKTLFLWLADGSDPNRHVVEAATRGLVFGTNPWARPKGFEHVHVRGFTFRYGASLPQRAAVWLHGAHNRLEDCVIEQMAGGGANVNGIMRHCVVRDCGHTGGGASGDDFLNEEDLWEGNCWKPISRGWDAGGFKMARVNGGVFRRCTFRRNGGPGLWFDIDVRNVVVTDCVFEENEGSGLFIEISRDITVTHNLAVSNAVGVVGQLGGDGWSSAGMQLGESENCVLTGNTCVGNRDGIALREQGPRPLRTKDRGEIPFHNCHHVIVGNLCAFNQGYQLGLWYDNAWFGWHPSEKRKYQTPEAWKAHLATIPDRIYDPRAQSLLLDGNLYWAAPGQSLFLYGVPWRPQHQKFDEIAAFSAATGFDRHSRVADPQLTGLAQGEFRLQPSSPAWQMAAGWLEPISPAAKPTK